MPIQVMEPVPVRQRPKRSARLHAEKGSSRIASGLFAELKKLVGPMIDEMLALAPWLSTRPGATLAMGALARQQDKWRRVLGPSIRGIAGRWVRLTSERDKVKLQASLAKALGVKAVSIFDEEPVKLTAELMGEQAVHLITTVPEIYHDKIQQAVMKSYQQERLPEGRDLIEEIQEIGKLTYERAKLIAVDQTNKMHGMITQTRQTTLGIEEYIWRTADDSRVVGDPSGKYPTGSTLHMNHYGRNGKVFRWDEPPEDGHPGWPIRCRCRAQPVINYEKLKLT